MTATDFVRVKLENGSEASVPAGFAETHELAPLDKPAIDRRGHALPAKHDPLSKAPADKASSTTPTRTGSEAAKSQEVTK